MAEVSSGRGFGWVRAAAAALVLITGGFAVRHSLGLTVAGMNPVLARRIDGENAFARAKAALVLIEAQPMDTARIRDLARSALRRDAGNVAALVALGLASDGQPNQAAILAASERLSRRDLLTQMWLIEKAVSRNDVESALRHYDIALRTSTNAPSILFPVLVGAVSDDTLLREIARTLARRPLWGGLYLQQLAQSGTDRHRIAVLFADLKGRGIATGAAADAALYDRLAEEQLFDDSWRVYVADHPGVVRDGIRNPGFANAPAVVAPFDWQVSDGDSVSARLEQITTGSGQLVFSTTAGEGGEIARQMLVLTPGSYDMRVDVGEIISGGDTPPYVRITCLPSGAELMREPLALRGTSVARVIVPAGCRAQSLTLVAQPGSGLATVEGTVRAVRISRAA